MNNIILNKILSKDTFGIFWLTKDYLNFSTNYLYEINYLLDNLLLKSMEQEMNLGKKDSNHFLWSKNFNQNFFVSHCIEFDNTQDYEQFLKMQFKIINPILSSKPGQITLVTDIDSQDKVNKFQKILKKYIASNIKINLISNAL